MLPSKLQSNLHFLFVDDQPVFQAGLSLTLLHDYPDAEFSFAKTINEARALLKEETIDVVTLDALFSDGNGLAFCEEIRNENASIKIVIISACNVTNNISCMNTSGANGYLEKNADGDEICFAMSQILKGKTYWGLLNGSAAGSISSASENNGNGKPLTAREQEVLRFICREFTDKKIAEQLHVARSTIANHRHHLHVKTRTKNNSGLAMYAKQNGLV